MLRSFSLAWAGAALLAFGGMAKAEDDLIRLDGKGDAQTVEARWGYGGFYRGGWGGGWNRGWGWGGGWNRGWHGGWNRGWGVGWNRGWGWGGGWGVGWNRGFYRPWHGWGHRPFVSAGWGGWGWAPSYYSVPVYSSYYISPCSTDMAHFGGTIATLGAAPATTFVPDNGTYPYDGGPRDGYLVPPSNAPAPMTVPGRKTLPRDGRLVSLPTPTADPYQFVAFGETPADASPAPTGGVFVSQPPPASRIIFPAYGETMPRSFSGDVSTFRISMK